MGLRRKIIDWAVKSKGLRIDPLKEDPDYCADGLKVWGKNVSFLSDEKFMNAYRHGMDSGHKIGRHSGSSEDIHIEWRVFVNCWAAQHALHLQGDFVECGTNTGICALSICNYIDFNATKKKFYLFDTFCGIPLEQASHSEKNHAEKSNKALYEDCWEGVKKNFATFSGVKLVRGKVPETLSEVSIEKVAFLHLDMNITYPEKCALEFFWDKLVPSGIVLFDDYGWKGYEEQKRSHDAFAASKKSNILLLPTGQGLLIKH